MDDGTIYCHRTKTKGFVETDSVQAHHLPSLTVIRLKFTTLPIVSSPVQHEKRDYPPDNVYRPSNNEIILLLNPTLTIITARPYSEPIPGL